MSSLEFQVKVQLAFNILFKKTVHLFADQNISCYNFTKFIDTPWPRGLFSDNSKRSLNYKNYYLQVKYNENHKYNKST